MVSSSIYSVSDWTCDWYIAKSIQIQSISQMVIYVSQMVIDSPEFLESYKKEKNIIFEVGSVVYFNKK